MPEDTSGNANSEVDILARIEKNLRDAPLAGFVAEGSAPFGAMSNSVDAALKRATFSGIPVVKVGRLLLMACLMKLGSLPQAANATNPTATEIEATKAKLKLYQEIFDTH